MSFVRALVLFAATFVTLGIGTAFSACIQLGPSDDSSADAGTPTVQEQCSEVMAAYCSRANECYGEDPNACYQPAVELCCGDACDKPATSEEKAIRACVLDISKENCDDVVVAKLPSRCNGVVTHD
ncbi:MAG TPA: hypothetical protein VNN72_17990 [Polyangiaceae bacterium]|nr:hypothetical protein [Polyangiaceae bacterium]